METIFNSLEVYALNKHGKKHRLMKLINVDAVRSALILGYDILVMEVK